MPDLSAFEQEVALALYRALADGEPVPLPCLAESVGRAEAEVARVLETGGLRGLVFRDADRRVIGFGGLRLVVTPDGVREVEPAEAVLSFLLPEAALFQRTSSEAIKSFCHYVYFLASAAAGAAWTAEHAGTFVLSIEDGFALARMNNAARFGQVLDGGG